MRIQVNGNDFGRVIGAGINNQTANYINHYNDISRSRLGEATLQNIQTISELTQSLVGFTDQRIIEQVQGSAGLSVTTNKFGYYPTYSAVQACSVHDVRWVMSQPTLQSMYQRGEVEGFDTDYLEVEIYQRPEKRRDYLLAMNGIMKPNGDIHHYTDNAVQENEQLSVAEKHNMLDMYGVVEKAIIEGIDPSSRFGSTF